MKRKIKIILTSVIIVILTINLFTDLIPDNLPSNNLTLKDIIKGNQVLADSEIPSDCCEAVGDNGTVQYGTYCLCLDLIHACFTQTCPGTTGPCNTVSCDN